MKKILTPIWHFCTDFTHWQHYVCGAIIFSLIYCLVYMSASEVISSATSASLATLIAMLTAEYKDKKHGSKFDWLDILAGMIHPIMYWLIYLIYII